MRSREANVYPPPSQVVNYHMFNSARCIDLLAEQELGFKKIEGRQIAAQASDEGRSKGIFFTLIN